MRKAIFTLSLLVAAFVGFNANAQEVQTQPTSKAVITIDKETHDYGTITQGDNGECEFVVTNTGSEPLIISRCKGSCGCTVPTCPQEPIAPGKSAVIKVKYDTNRVGPIAKSVTITSNAGNEPNKVIRIKGQIKAKPADTAPTN
ncbi:DUF1573 domain-containing protein [Paracrocinitomix mangrovi]|uniref:DUF1573 domain-containing protein n=1 Tax=Paracrocinitomix mangrovi TaxID=2862509 RepID=UPI001C8E0C21|nr:DUF1573 domain-containing protein [Paracrocinitomix mangrovi]UKN01583.1 DUF1573 domain-containing protein [Paracrocinitomix mangrovi]